MRFRCRFPGRAVAAGALAVTVLAGCTQAVDGHPQASGGTSGRPGAPSSSPSVPPTSPPIAPVQFRDCSSVLKIPALKIPTSLAGKLSAQCGTVHVPIDYAKPDGAKLGLFMIRIHDSDNTGHLGSLFLNPGGPGGSGVDLALGLLSQISPTVLQHFDLLGFDPRGVGYSTPVRCLTNTQQDAFDAASPDITTAAGVARQKQLDRQFAQRCEQKYGSALAHFDTVDTARDIDEIRLALGEHKISYLGFSYGTELGSVYAHLFPNKVRVAVLDGAVDPNQSIVQSTEVQLSGFERGFTQFAAWCKQHSPCKTVGDPTAVAIQLLASVQRSPMPTGTSRPLTASLAVTGIGQALYSHSSWPRLGTALVEAHDGNGAGLLGLADAYYERSSNGSYPNLTQANEVINCNDSGPGLGDALVHKYLNEWRAKYPIFGASFAAGLYGCVGWQPHRTVPPKPTAPTATKVLVIGNVNDPVTPYQGAKDLTAAMGNAELLTWDGTPGHTSYLQGSSCIDDAVNAYLIHEKLPPENTTCPK